MNSEVIAQCGSAMAAGLSRQREWPTNAQLFLIGNSAPMADLHSGACTSLNPWPCQTQQWGKVKGMMEKNKREEKLESRGVKRNNKKKRLETIFCFLHFCFYVIMDCAGTGLTQVAWRAYMFNDRVCQMAKALCVSANVSTALKCSCAHLKKKKRGKNNS